MMLKLVDTTGNIVASMLDNEALLGSYNPQDFYTIHIIDLDPSTVNFDNLDDVPKYEISEDAYNAREVNFRKFKEEMKKTHPDLMKSNKNEVDDEFQADLARDIQVGNRCKVNPGDKRGEVCFVGKMPTFKPGYWVGIRLDEPLGKNDGSHGGTRYFECAANYGLFLRPNAVEVGNFRPYDEDEEI
jgi:tubulin-specific chaperone B